MFNSFTPMEITVLIVFVFYLMFNIDTPEMIAEIVETPIGLLSIMVMIMYLFFYGNPIIAIMFIFVAYELLKRSALVTGRKALMDYTPSQSKKNIQMKAMNPPKEKTLEEEMVEKMAPIGKSEMIDLVETGFKPVAAKTPGASKL